MSQSIVRFPVRAQERQQLRLEKVGVIGGFLLGLAAAAGLVLEPLVGLGLPEGLNFLAFALVVAAATRLGLAASTALARHLAR